MVSGNHNRTDPAIARDRGGETSFAADEDKILRYLGAAVIMQWNTLPTKLQRELFDKAGSYGRTVGRRVTQGADPFSITCLFAVLSRAARPSWARGSKKRRLAFLQLSDR
jgi:hypothetical protein